MLGASARLWTTEYYLLPHTYWQAVLPCMLVGLQRSGQTMIPELAESACLNSPAGEYLSADVTALCGRPGTF